MGRLFAYLVDLVLAIVVGKLLNRALQSFFGTSPSGGAASATPRGPRSRASRTETVGAMERDPVCGMFVSTELSHRLSQDGRTLHFCSQDCLNRYQNKEVKAQP
ncbi:MAG TPA: hypothetical protein VKU44_06125 [Terriglobia bacterium]|nr:hypothetical protein [Terriglobia bacterium]